jgi:hypothetical protein|tara:strand:- start:27 stop:620 length:594 start_codon:yes stop_codon:yes gene_type:complete
MESITLEAINSNIDAKFNELTSVFLAKLEGVSARLDKIEQKVEIIEKTITNKPMLSDDLRSILKEKLDLSANKKQIVKLLNAKNVEADVKIFAEYYIIKYNDGANVNYSSPIKSISARKYQYWNNGKWIDDMDGYYIKKVLVYNIQKLYLKANTFSVNSEEDTDIFEENQKYIDGMSNDKYSRLFMRELRSYLNMLT